MWIETSAGGSSLFLGPRLLEDCNPPSGEPQLGSSQGLYGLHSDHYPRTDGVKYEGLPCCFYEEKQVAHSAGRGNGCYTEDYSVSVQYTLTEEPPPSCYAGPRDLSQRIPIIPEDVDCDLGLPQDCHGMHNHSPWGGALSLDVPRLHWSLGTTREEEQAPCYQAEVQPGCSPEEAGASRASLSSAPQDTQESHALAAEASGENR